MLVGILLIEIYINIWDKNKKKVLLIIFYYKEKFLDLMKFLILF